MGGDCRALSRCRAGYRAGDHSASLGRAHRHRRGPRPRRQARVAGMGAGARNGPAPLCRNRAQRSRPRAGLHHFRPPRQRGRGKRVREFETPGRAGSRRRPACPAGEQHMSEEQTQTRAGFVALIGEPNAGKSTLLNRMVGAKVSIVTHKVQTTRARIRGVAIEGASQIVFVDTPGIFRPRRRLDRSMVAAAWGGAADADVVVLLIEAHRGVTEGVERIIEGLAELPRGRKVALAINKIDRVEAPELLALSKDLNDRYAFANTFMISAERGYGVADL